MIFFHVKRYVASKGKNQAKPTFPDSFGGMQTTVAW